MTTLNTHTPVTGKVSKVIMRLKGDPPPRVLWTDHPASRALERLLVDAGLAVTEGVTIGPNAVRVAARGNPDAFDVADVLLNAGCRSVAVRKLNRGNGQGGRSRRAVYGYFLNPRPGGTP